jgi:hypothetical protein
LAKSGIDIPKLRVDIKTAKSKKGVEPEINKSTPDDLDDLDLDSLDIDDLEDIEDPGENS